jgi:hypothetical protein
MMMMMRQWDSAVGLSSGTQQWDSAVGLSSMFSALIISHILYALPAFHGFISQRDKD